MNGIKTEPFIDLTGVKTEPGLSAWTGIKSEPTQPSLTLKSEPNAAQYRAQLQTHKHYDNLSGILPDRVDLLLRELQIKIQTGPKYLALVPM